MNKDKLSMKVNFQYIGDDTNQTPISPDFIVSNELLKYFDETYNDISKNYSSNKDVSIYDILDDIYSEDQKKAIDIYFNFLEHFKNKLNNYSYAFYLTDPFFEVFESTGDFNIFDYMKDNFNFKAYLFKESSYISEVLLDLLFSSKIINNLTYIESVVSLLKSNNNFSKNGESLTFNEIKSIFLKEFKNNETALSYFNGI